MMSRRRVPARRLAAAILLSLAGAATAFAANAPATPEGYRMSHYRAPTPERLPGATTIGTATAASMLQAGSAVFLDVLPAPARPAGRVETEWNVPVRHTLPGAHWLPNVGHGALSERMESYYRLHLERLTGGRKDRAIVVFCNRDCWMSWNAAKRALAYGYSDVYWYPDGVDGWMEAGRALVPAHPEGDGPP